MTRPWAEPLDHVIEGAVNLRDLGGIPAGERRVRRGQIFRSGTTGHLTHKGVAALARRIGVRTVIDFRNDLEVQKDGVPDFAAHGIRHVHNPVTAVTTLTPEERKSRMRGFMDGSISWSVAYNHMAGSASSAFVRMFETLAAAEGIPAIFHCAAGRDRTGVAAALLLEMLGAEREHIVDDYHATGPALQAHTFRYSRVIGELEMTEDEFAALLMTRPEAMEEFLDYLRESHGGAIAYLVDNGLPREAITDLRSRLLE